MTVLVVTKMYFTQKMSDLVFSTKPPPPKYVEQLVGLKDHPSNYRLSFYTFFCFAPSPPFPWVISQLLHPSFARRISVTFSDVSPATCRKQTEDDATFQNCSLDKANLTKILVSCRLRFRGQDETQIGHMKQKKMCQEMSIVFDETTSAQVSGVNLCSQPVVVGFIQANCSDPNEKH